MLTKEECTQILMDTGVVAVIRVDSGSELVDIMRALKKGGVLALEVTMTSPGALEAIREASSIFKDEAVIGAGTVLDPETAEAAIRAGANFIVSPVTNFDLIKLCRRYSVMCIPGAFTPTEILAAWEAGADFVKVFPSSSVGPSYLKDILGPLPQVRLTPTGGVNLQNAGDFIRAGASFVGAGSSLVKKDFVKEKRWDDLAELASKFIQEVKAARTRK
ncbi:MAG: bifunctional 4-hydroxy-2-oxoglutarate aldolase/2-dehydro-3-deoxy-phosphogluconate aldolase [Bacillota bacterium]|nr:bifunctional 4-hydroxy-2-oxoglutarate aldolase/2-dehydro-3-deoxy-phosphogluconate aldolase [Bacillota bacterium]MDI9415028.1 bifunctional 4-hydroxy-2-oxoglutarate aldolase/2-dehydro-3-deoxy-phosphogluconate aldolase [Bacillota bacterium]HOB88716.1 bifunctional 4-hydroxy-2-oxoglutarate aldolase/2-dehydro-3-deoxy-phosphogluconate aldolase [Bacillota bacterium]HOJ58310.1 bifunctional 4-hydroxy-2-oxoglutarate aldolase/2-dehydro-3-deoxy-phosphogluconate aldolase [Bacillota bacterium]HOL02632.1 bi